MLENPRSGLRKLHAVPGASSCAFFHSRGLVGLVQIGPRCHVGRHKDTDLHEERFLARPATQRHSSRTVCLKAVGEGVRCVGWDVDGLASAHDRLLAAATTEQSNSRPLSDPPDIHRGRVPRSCGWN